MAHTVKTSPAQQRALLGAEDTPHGPRLDTAVPSGTAVALMTRGLCTHLTTPPWADLAEDSEDTPPWGHWLTPEGVRVRDELRAAPPVETGPARCRCRHKACTQDAAWTLKWKNFYAKTLSTGSCDQHLAELTREYSRDAREQAVLVVPA